MNQPKVIMIAHPKTRGKIEPNSTILVTFSTFKFQFNLKNFLLQMVTNWLKVLSRNNIWRSTKIKTGGRRRRRGKQGATLMIYNYIFITCILCKLVNKEHQLLQFNFIIFLLLLLDFHSEWNQFWDDWYVQISLIFLK